MNLPERILKFAAVPKKKKGSETPKEKKREKKESEAFAEWADELISNHITSGYLTVEDVKLFFAGNKVPYINFADVDNDTDNCSKNINQAVLNKQLSEYKIHALFQAGSLPETIERDLKSGFIDFKQLAHMLKRYFDIPKGISAEEAAKIIKENTILGIIPVGFLYGTVRPRDTEINTGRGPDNKYIIGRIQYDTLIGIEKALEDGLDESEQSLPVLQVGDEIRLRVSKVVYKIVAFKDRTDQCIQIQRKLDPPRTRGKKIWWISPKQIKKIVID